MHASHPMHDDDMHEDDHDDNHGGHWRDVEVDLERAAASAAAGAARVAGRFEELAEEIAGRVAEAVSGVEEHLSSLDLGEHDAERLRLRMAHVGERFAERLEHRMRRAVVRAARGGKKVARARVGIGDRTWDFDLGGDNKVSAADQAVPGASGDEVMTILRMVEEKRISAEEAETLLAALRR